MAAKLRFVSSLFKFPLSGRLAGNRRLVSDLFNKTEVSGWFKLFSTVMTRRGVVDFPLTRHYHVGPSLGVKASQLSKDITLEKADVGCPICSANITFSYKDVLFLSQFLSPEGNLLNKRITGVCGKQQKKLEKAIKISRRLGLLPKCGPISSTETSHSPQS